MWYFENTEAIRKIRQYVCDEICKYPVIYTSQEWGEIGEKICDDCLLNKLDEREPKKK